MNALLKLTLTLAATSILAGCQAPGLHLSHQAEGESSSESLEGQVKVTAITPTLIQSMVQPPYSPQPNTQLDEERGSYDYVVGKGDILNITVWNHPELTIPAGSERSAQEAGNWVHNDGTIFYPYVGKVDVEGLKVTEIRDLITERLARYIETPQVDVTVAGFRSKRIYVTGEVTEPGAQRLTNIPLTLLDAVAASGGLTEMADWGRIVLSRDGEETSFSLRDLYSKGNINENAMLRDGDIVHVSRNDASKVFVLGEVKEAGSIPMQRYGMTLAEALSDSGGLNEMNANASGIFVMRPAAEGSSHMIDVFQLDASDATALILADQFRLEERDIVYVTTAPISRWNRIIQQVLPTAQTLYFMTLTEDRLSDRL